MSKTVSINFYNKIYNPILNLIRDRIDQGYQPELSYLYMLEKLNYYKAHIDAIHFGVLDNTPELQSEIKKFFIEVFCQLKGQLVNNADVCIASLMDIRKSLMRREALNLYEKLKTILEIENPIYLTDEQLVVWCDEIIEILYCNNYESQ